MDNTKENLIDAIIDAKTEIHDLDIQVNIGGDLDLIEYKALNLKGCVAVINDLVWQYSINRKAREASQL